MISGVDIASIVGCHGSDIPEVNCRTCAHVTPDLDTGKFAVPDDRRCLGPGYTRAKTISSSRPSFRIRSYAKDSGHISYGGERGRTAEKDGYDSGNFRGIL